MVAMVCKAVVDIEYFLTMPTRDAKVFLEIDGRRFDVRLDMDKAGNVIISPDKRHIGDQHETVR